jgi:hypothetical protein
MGCNLMPLLLLEMDIYRKMLKHDQVFIFATYMVVPNYLIVGIKHAKHNASFR